MAEEKLPPEYDVIVLGTGMTECIVAAALSRIGQSVLHLDRNDYYSGDWASFHFEGLKQWIRKQQTGDSPFHGCDASLTTDLLEEGESFSPLIVDSKTISNVKEHIFVRKEPIPPPDNVKDVEEVSKQVADLELNERLEESPQTAEKTDNEQLPSETTETAETQQEDLKEVPETEGTEAGNEVMSKMEETVQHAAAGGGKLDKDADKQWSFSEINQQWRKFSIDLMPKLLYCRGSMVELLIKSDIAKYCEFKCVSRVATCINGVIEQVPCSRADVFSSKKVTMVEKRMMMKFLVFCLEFEEHQDEYAGFADRPFIEFLLAKKLTATIRHYIQHAIAMVTDAASTIEGLKCTQRFLQSLGRYGNTAFLWPLYGSGELPQCFCRMCAVFGGVYCLSRTGQAMITDDNKRCKAIVDTEGQRLTCKYLIMDASYAHPQMLLTPPSERKLISRAVLLTDRSFLRDSRDHVTLLHLPVSSDRPHLVTIVELAPSAMASPAGIFVVHVTCTATCTAQDDLSPVIDLFFTSFYDNDDETANTVPDRWTDDSDNTGEKTEEDCSEEPRPRILWALYFNVAVTENENMAANVGDNIFVVGGPDGDLDFEMSITEARRIFETICKGEEFLPKAPNPEDIIYDDETKSGGIDEPTEGEAEEKTYSNDDDDVIKNEEDANNKS